MKIKKCLNCGDRIKGRSDKKFCDDQCRAQHNNKLNNKPPFYVNKINAILKKNRKVLEEIINSSLGEKSKVYSRSLYERGYNFNYQTHMHTENTGLTYSFCYEYGYAQLDKELYIVIKREQK
jgi:hypothetical protein